MKLTPADENEVRNVLEQAGIRGDDLRTGLATILRLTPDDIDYRTWLTTMRERTAVELIAIYGHDAARHAAAILHHREPPQPALKKVPEYAALAEAALAESRHHPNPDRNIARAQVYATLALAAAVRTGDRP